MTLCRVFRLTSILLVPVLLSNSLAFAAKKAPDPAAMKAKIQAHGVGQGVRVSLANKEEASGLIVAIGDLSFTLKQKKSADERQIEYAQLTGVYNNHLTRGQKVGVVVGIVAIGVVITAVILVHKVDNAFKF